jgi:hypothetical protein
MQDEFRVIARRSCPTRDNAAHPFVIALHRLEWSTPLPASVLGGTSRKFISQLAKAAVYGRKARTTRNCPRLKSDFMKHLKLIP